jgi:mono/diheme cytochrome c family protein
MKITCWHFVFFSFFALWLFCCTSDPPPEMTAPGALIYYGYTNKEAQCSRCHGDEGQGGMFGPQIRDAAQKIGVDSVRAVIINGRGKGDKRMPDFEEELTATQIDQVMQFLQTWNIAALLDSAATK